MTKTRNRTTVHFGLKLNSKFLNQQVGGFIGAAIVFLLGFYLVAFPSKLSQTLTRASYDCSFDLCRFARPDLNNSGVVIIYIDAKSLENLNGSLLEPMKRSYQAELLKRLKKDGAKAVVMDIVFSDPRPDSKGDKMFAEALRSNGRVVLGVDYYPSKEEDIKPLQGGLAVLKRPLQKVLTSPYAPFEKAAAKMGTVMIEPDTDLLARKPLHRLQNDKLELIDNDEFAFAPPSLSWAAAQLVGLKVTQNPAQQ